MNLSHIIFIDIDEEYGYGTYAGFKIIIMKENNYFNSSKLCKDYNKDYNNWLKNNRELINKVGISIEINTKKYDGMINGIYLHDLLLPNILSWISTEFEIKINKIVNNFIINDNDKFGSIISGLTILQEEIKNLKDIATTDQIVQSNNKLIFEYLIIILKLIIFIKFINIFINVINKYLDGY
jgi:translation initiation factor 2 alpha subunit (eIF-2alpha)